MTETHDLRNQWYDEPVQYETPMTKIEGEIKIHFEPEVIDDIYMRLGINKPKETYQQMLEQSLIREGYKMGYYESTHKNQMINKQEPPTIIEIGGVKYQRMEEPKPKVRTLYDICEEWSDDGSTPVSDLIDRIEKEWTPLNLNQKENRGFTDGYSMGFDDALNMVRKTLR